MSNQKPPTRANGKICYLEIPANDIQVSAKFYQDVFKWEIRSDNEGNVTFDDTVGEVSGMWILGRKPATDTGIIISIMVKSIDDTISAIEKSGGRFIEKTSGVTTLFADPAGNVMCLYQSRI